MTNEELEQEVKKLEEQLTELRFKILESKGMLIPYKPYEVEVPKDIENYYFLDEIGNGMCKVLYSSNYQKRTFMRGLGFETKEEAERYDRERILLFKMYKWAEEHNGDWIPNWKDFNEIKYFIICNKEKGEFDINRCRCFRQLTKLPLFKTEEIAEQFIDEFRDEIIEVLC